MRFLRSCLHPNMWLTWLLELFCSLPGKLNYIP